MAKLKPWPKVASPHSDVREGTVGMGRFAVKIMDVVNGEAPKEYQDPATFFNRTFFTRNLKKILKMVLRRLSGKGEGENVIQLLTHFGGGKSHTLLALYHLFENAEEIAHMDEVKELKKESGIRKVPSAKTCVIAGTYLNPLKGREVEDDVTLNTLWGEIAYQLGGKELYEEVRENDEKRISPGEEALKKILKKSTPFLILIDELTIYATKAHGVKEYNLHEQTLSFITELTEVISSLEDATLLVTLPKSPYERAGEAAEEIYELTYEKVTRRFGRIEEAWTPIEDDEIHEVVRKRLFEKIGERDIIKKIAQQYWDFYLDKEGKVTHDACEPEMRERIKKSYPFHPYLIDTLYKRWGALPRFQRTRGVLRLLALVINDLYPKSTCPLIHPSDVNFTNERIKSEVMRYLTDEKWRGVISNDIATLPPKIDKELGSEYEREELSVKLARTIFLFSHPAEQAGIDKKGMAAAVLYPGFVFPEMITEILQRFEQVGENGLWFLDSANGRYFFKTTPGLGKIIVDAEEKIRSEAIDQKIKDLISNMIMQSEIINFTKVYLYPERSGDIADLSKLGISILGAEHAIKGELEENTKKFTQNMLENYKEGARIYKNSLIFLFPDSDQNSSLTKNVRTYLALQSINEDKFVQSQFNEDQKERLKRKLKFSEKKLPTSVVQTYKYLVKGVRGGKLKLRDMGISTVFSNNIISTVWRFLQDEGIVCSSVDPALIIRKILPSDEDYIDLNSVKESFFRFYGLPIPGSENVVEKAIKQGVKLGEFGLGRGNPEERKYSKLLYKEMPKKVDLSKDWYLIAQETAKEVKTEILKEMEEEVSVTPKIPKKKEEIPEERAEAKIHKLEINSEIPCEKLSDFQRGVITPLANLSDELKLKIDVSAHSKEGVGENKIENKIEIPIKETLEQIAKSYKIKPGEKE